MKVILLTGATDGIGYETAKRLVQQGHNVLLHGRSMNKLHKMMATTPFSENKDRVETYACDLSHLKEIRDFTSAIQSNHDNVDVIINNAGVFKISDTKTVDGLDARFAVNTIAPYMITQHLMPQLQHDSESRSRVVNVSSAAQAPVHLASMQAHTGRMDDSQAYAQSKLAITMWTTHLSQPGHATFPMMVSVNPASLLGSKMVKSAYGINGKDLGIGADIFVRAALSEEFESADGKYYNNDAGKFDSPHPDGLNSKKCAALVDCMEGILDRLELN